MEELFNHDRSLQSLNEYATPENDDVPYPVVSNLILRMKRQNFTTGVRSSANSLMNNTSSLTSIATTPTHPDFVNNFKMKDAFTSTVDHSYEVIVQNNIESRARPVFDRPLQYSNQV